MTKHLLAVLLLISSAQALPIKPDLEKILQHQDQRPRHYEPARAGWDGPEMPPPGQTARNPVYEAYGPESTARAVRAALVAAAIPDPLAVLAIGVLILMFRFTRQRAARPATVIPIRPAITTDQSKAA